MGEGREGDWECSGCKNRNYAFRSLCNRCKQPRILVDANTPKDSKWIPRIGDWICTGCSNNNYAFRENCKKCDRPKEEAAMPVVAMPGASLPAIQYFARVKTNNGIPGNSMLQQLCMTNSDLSFGGPSKYGLQEARSWPFNGASSTGYPHAGNTNPLGVVPPSWRSGDWICNCGFHNYSSRMQCKECNAPSPSGAHFAAVSALGAKRPASEEFGNDWENKRQNAGDINRNFLERGQQYPYHGFEQLARISNGLTSGSYSRYPTGNSEASIQGNFQPLQLPMMPALIGKGAKQWRDGDWMCSNCDNHNYASRSNCNRCETPKEAVAAAATASVSAV